MKKRIISLTLSLLIIISCTVIGFGAGYDSTGFSSAVLSAWQNEETSLDVMEYNVPRSSFYGEYLKIWVNHPELCNVYTEVSSVPNTVDTISKIYPEYFGYTKSEIEAFNLKVDEIVNSVSGRSDIDKVIGFYEYLIENAKYDYRSDDETIKKYSPYEAIMGDRCVCQGYSLAFKLLCTKAGIECHYISSQQNEHAWNMVKLNDKYYYIDITWDYYDHSDLLVGEDALVDTQHLNTSSDWTSDEDANVNGLYNNTEYDEAFWVNAVNRMTYDNGYWYYTDGKDVYKASTETMTSEKLTNHTSGYFWFNSIGSSYGYSNRSDLEELDGKIYFTTPTQIRCVDTDGNNEVVVYTLTDSEKQKGYIYDITVENGKIEYGLSFNPLCVNDLTKFTYTGSLSLDCGNHNLTAWTQLAKSTCITLGSQVRQCKNCAYFEIQSATSYAAHSVSEWTVLTPSTCIQSGERKGFCSVCQKEITESAPLAEHTYGEWTVVKEATCKEQGLKQRVCSVCDNVDTEKIENGAHSVDADSNGVCTLCGQKVCSCLCHSSNGFLKFIYKIERFFWKIFDYSGHKYCSCGAKHY